MLEAPSGWAPGGSQGTPGCPLYLGEHRVYKGKLDCFFFFFKSQNILETLQRLTRNSEKRGFWSVPPPEFQISIWPRRISFPRNLEPQFFLSSLYWKPNSLILAYNYQVVFLS